MEKASSSSETAKPTETTPLVAVNNSKEESQTKGLSVKQATLLLSGEMAGSGVLALPRALVKTGWVGVPILILMCGIAAFSGKRLGDCWSIIEERNPGLRSRQRNPYAIIANEALGKTWSVIVSIAVTMTLFGASVVYLLMAAQIIEEVFMSLFTSVSYCLWFVIVCALVTPLLFFGTPRDFSFVGLIAIGSTVIACVFYFIQMTNDAKPYRVFRWGIHGFQNFFLAFGTIMFAFGGASAFPTIQNDMRNKNEFHKSVYMSYISIILLYLPIAITGYAVYGESVAPNVATSITPTFLTQIANVLMAIHLLSGFTIIINPVCQEIEEFYRVPRDSKCWRFLVRSSLMIAILFIGESIPKFDTVLALVGGTTVALLTYVLPSFCYLKLISAEGQTAIANPMWMKIVLYEVIAIGTVGGIAATFSAISAIFSTLQARPCYLR